MSLPHYKGTKDEGRETRAVQEFISLLLRPSLSFLFCGAALKYK
ncbi:MAG: hypothetical protein JWO06_2480 [Bacteroidota bacterium]|nr:hypothetical protein [Bacteroidota bacterium]